MPGARSKRAASCASSSPRDLKADLSEADLSDADLRGTNLSGADLWRANLIGACISPEGLHKALQCRKT
jgi:uncharacterized protein YjbI with pentapeptide repeats